MSNEQRRLSVGDLVHDVGLDGTVCVEPGRIASIGVDGVDIVWDDDDEARGVEEGDLRWDAERQAWIRGAT